jgi:pimeloyl-ACP methyl ester carboxylesterase
MPIAQLDGIDLYYEDTGSGAPLVWSHEFGGDCRSWEPQVRHFARRYRVITYNHRGYPPSSVPKSVADFSPDILVADLHGLLRHLNLGPVHLAGCSMGANAVRDFALAHPAMLRATPGRSFSSSPPAARRARAAAGSGRR